MDFQFTRLGHVALFCNRYEETLAFYTEKLGFEKAFELQKEDGSLWLTYIKVNDGQFIELFPEPYPSDNRTADHSYHHICLEIDNFPAAVRSLEAAGVPVLHGPSYNRVRCPEPLEDHPEGMCGSLCAFIVDPEGNDIELMQFTPNSRQMQP